ncbi:MAG TPA: T9SS type A sorting domain-containing protein [Bacteroidia bacterium]|nr:T9SS type A sorting domain-containing protein [Bacteroidia bacterium]
MKKQIIIILLILSSNISFSQNWQWAKQIGGNLTDWNGGALIDANNNIYSSGNYEISCFFDNDTLNSNGYNDMFLAKYDASGSELWTRGFGGNNSNSYHEAGLVAAIDNNNSCLYYIGHFEGILTIDSYSINSATGATMFIAKFDLSGNCQWLVGIGSGGSDFPAALTLDGSGNIYFTGNFGNNGTIGIYTVNKGCFLTKLDSGGNILWARNEITGGYITAIKIVNNNMILCGIADNDTSVIDTATLITTNMAGVFLAKTDLNGNYINGKRFASNVISYPNNLELDVTGNIYLIGQATDTINFDGIILSNNGLPDLFFGKFDNSFNTVWVQQSHSNGAYGGYGANIIPDNDGNYYITGSFSGNATLDTFNLNSSATQDMFLARYDPNGKCIGIRHFGEARSESLNMDSNGDIIVAGEFINTANIGSTILTSHGSTDIFIAKSDAITGIGGEGRVATNQLIIYANPNKGTCNITVPDEFQHEKNLTLNIFDNSGKLIQQIPVQMNEGKIKLNLEAEAKGVYNVTLSNGKKSYNGKIVFE